MHINVFSRNCQSTWITWNSIIFLTFSFIFHLLLFFVSFLFFLQKIINIHPRLFIQHQVDRVFTVIQHQHLSLHVKMILANPYICQEIEQHCLLIKQVNYDYKKNAPVMKLNVFLIDYCSTKSFRSFRTFRNRVSCHLYKITSIKKCLKFRGGWRVCAPPFLSMGTVI